MRLLDLIEAKKRGLALTAEQLAWVIDAYVADRVPDYQMAALLMAIRWRGLTEGEAIALTEAMVVSGERYDLSDLDGPAVDKHSTGGVGDKVSLPLAPLAAACGCVVPMISGRGLGHTGGTLDKLESIPGLRTDLGAERFRAQLERLGVAMGAQTENFVPADRRLYALRDVTGTVDEAGLITASILSKKIAEGAQALVLDVKVGSGAFFQRREQAVELADRLLRVARGAGLACSALLTDMDQPLGLTIGNTLEVEESIAMLRGEGPEDLRQLVLELGAEMLCLGDLAADRDAALADLRQALSSGAAYDRFVRLVEAQGGDTRCIDDPSRLPRAAQVVDLSPAADGWVGAIDARGLGRAAIALRAGRDTKEDRIDPGAGLVLHAKRGDHLDRQTPWISLHYGDGADVESARGLIAASLTITADPPELPPLILERRA